MRLLGVLCILIGAGGMGFSLSRDIKLRLKNLKMQKRMLLMLRGEIKYRNAALTEGFYHVAKSLHNPFGIFLERVHMELEGKNGQMISEIWTREAQAQFKDMALSKSDIEHISELGGQLGYLDREMQLTTLDLYIENLEREIADIEKEISGKARIYSWLGIMGGLLLTIILV